LGRIILLLEINGLNVYYRDLQALFDVSFSVNQGEFVSIIGSNAAGKSTLLKTISGILKPKTGTIRFEGQDLARLPTHKIVEMGICQVPEGRQLFPVMTVLENLEMGSFTPNAKKKRAQTLEKVYEIFPKLRARFDQLAGTLSGGEQQMVAIARALMALPVLLMFDEPSLGLAPLAVREMFRVANEINDLGTTVLMVEQNVYNALDMCQQAYILENGRIVRKGKGRELLESEVIKKSYLGI
jgi:branched-chain amino acid transport system ATP-binding protein